MSQLTKCTGNDCPLKENCHRFKSESAKVQSWFTHKYVELKDGTATCEYFVRHK